MFKNILGICHFSFLCIGIVDGIRTTISILSVHLRYFISPERERERERERESPIYCWHFTQPPTLLISLRMLFDTKESIWAITLLRCDFETGNIRLPLWSLTINLTPSPCHCTSYSSYDPYKIIRLIVRQLLLRI